MHVFIAGIMQGSRQDDRINAQDYRQRITTYLHDHIPGVQIIDPYALHPNSVDYELKSIRETFLAITAMAGDADALIAFLPHASMGTAIEIWTAYHANKPIVAVTPLEHNWVVKVTANEVLPDLESLLEYIRSGRFAQLVRDRSAAVDANPGQE